MRTFLSSLMLLALASPAWAVDPNVAPEPGSLWLLALAAAAGAVTYFRRKK